MNARPQRSRLRTTVIVVGAAAALVFGSLGVWARVRTGVRAAMAPMQILMWLRTVQESSR